MIVYAVSCGSYSDWDIESVFSSKEKAQEYIDFQKSMDGYTEVNDNILKYEVDAWRKLDILWARIDMVYNQLTVCIQEEQPNGYTEGKSFNNSTSMFVKIHFNTSLEKMKKSALDRYYMFMARNEGI